MNTVKLSLVVDNKSEEDLASEHGYSLHIKTSGCSLLLDTGQSDLLFSNARAMKIDLKKLDGIVLSHGHYDHSGGLATLLENNPKVQIYLHRQATRERFSLNSAIAKRVHIQKKVKQAIQNHPQEAIHSITKPTLTGDILWVTGTIPRITDFEDTGGHFFLDDQGNIKDYLHDDMAVWAPTEKGLVVCLGCCHAGVINTLKYITNLSGEQVIHTIIGGMHLLHATEERLNKTIEQLKQFNLKRIIACHCSGDSAVSYLKQHLPFEVSTGYAGLELTL